MLRWLKRHEGEFTGELTRDQRQLLKMHQLLSCLLPREAPRPVWYRRQSTAIQPLLPEDLPAALPLDEATANIAAALWVSGFFAQYHSDEEDSDQENEEDEVMER